MEAEILKSLSNAGISALLLGIAIFGAFKWGVPRIADAWEKMQSEFRAMLEKQSQECKDGLQKITDTFTAMMAEERTRSDEREARVQEIFREEQAATRLESATRQHASTEQIDRLIMKIGVPQGDDRPSAMRFKDG